MMQAKKSRPNLNDFYNTIFRFKQWKSEAEIVKCKEWYGFIC